MIKIINYSHNPLTLMGEVASRCWNSKPSPRIGIECIENGHGRILEYPDITVEISGYSARVMREIYTHIVGTSRVQESTRYVDMSDFNYYTPDTILNNDNAKRVYDTTMKLIKASYETLLEMGIPKQDTANLLPIGSNSKMILKINLRALLHMCEVRLCTRALKEFRDFMKELLDMVKQFDSEWNQIINNYAKPKCDILGYCNEKHTCGRIPQRSDSND